MCCTAGIAVEVTKVHVATEDVARGHGGSCPPRPSESTAATSRWTCGKAACGSRPRTDGCGDQIACRVWMYRGQEYTEPPTELIVDAILHTYGALAAPPPTRPYEMPENPRRFFASQAGSGPTGNPPQTSSSPRQSQPARAANSGAAPRRSRAAVTHQQRRTAAGPTPNQGVAAVNTHRGPSPPDAETVWRDLRGPLLNFISRRVSDRDSAEDILQDVMLRIHSHADELTDGRAVDA